MTSTKNHPSFPITISESQKIWRYMDFTKFAYLIESQSLWFNRIDKFDDPFEGTYPLKNMEALRDSEHAKLEVAFRQFRQITYANCWYISDHESVAMWKLYGQSSMAVAIQSTYGKLYQCMPSECYIGEIDYINYETDTVDIGNAFSPHMKKRLEFSHEKELRAIIQDKLPTKKNPNGEGEIHDVLAINEKQGLVVPVDLTILIENVFIAPMTRGWFKDLVKIFTNKNGFSDRVIQVSKLDTEPY